MRLSELLSARVTDRSGRSLGRVRDVRLTADSYEVVGLVIGGGPLARIAHAWGYAEGRAQAPWILRTLTRRAVAQARFVPAQSVIDWRPPQLRLDVDLADLPSIQKALRQ